MEGLGGDLVARETNHVIRGLGLGPYSIPARRGGWLEMESISSAQGLHPSWLTIPP